MSSPPDTSRRAQLLLVVGIALVALNLRPALASVGPLVQDIRAATGLSNAALGVLTTLPLVAFGLLSVLASRVGRRIGVDRAIGLALVLIAVGTGLRWAPSVLVLYLGTALLGVGVALGNVLIPAIAKREFPENAGAITSLYSGMMGVGAAIAAGISVPLARSIGWRGALGIWALPAVVAFVVWLPRAIRARMGTPSRRESGSRTLGRSPLAWRIALYLGLQSLTFYVILAWLPELLQTRGASAVEAGGLLALSQVTGTLGSVAIPIWAQRLDDQRPIVWALGVGEAAALVWLFLPGMQGAVFWVGLLGFVLGGTFALALTLLAIRSPDAQTTGDLSGMAQSIGYLLAAAAPPLVGILYDFTAGWTVPIMLLAATLVGKVSAGLPASRVGEVEAQ